jgi:hypothetical protein
MQARLLAAHIKFGPLKSKRIPEVFRQLRQQALKEQQTD